MSSYAFFVQTFQEEHKEKHPDASVNFSEFSKKCSEKWTIMSAKEKGKFEDMAKADKACYEREIQTYIHPKRDTSFKKEVQVSQCIQEASFGLFLILFLILPPNQRWTFWPLHQWCCKEIGSDVE